MFLDKGDDVLALLVRDEGALDAGRFSASDGRIEHVAEADQLLRAALVEDNAALECGRHRKGDAGRDVGLHEAGDDVGGRTLRRDDQVHARRTAHLGDTADALFHILGGHQHQVGQLVDDDDHPRQRLPALFLLDAVVGVKVSHADFGEGAVALEHLHHRPLQRAGGLLRVGDDRDIEVRDAVVDAELDHLRVDHDELHLIRARLIQQAQDQRVHADRLA